MSRILVHYSNNFTAYTIEMNMDTTSTQIIYDRCLDENEGQFGPKYSNNINEEEEMTM